MIVSGPVTVGADPDVDESYVESWKATFDYAAQAEAGHIRCSVCHERLQVPFLMWAGVGDDIFLHGPCAEHWVWALARDIHELRHLQGER